MAARVAWTPEARRTLRLVYEFIATDSPQNALMVVRKILERTRQIAVFPLSGRVVPEHGIADMREIFWRDYRIHYRPDAGGVTILAVFHGSRSLENVFDEG